MKTKHKIFALVLLGAAIAAWGFFHIAGERAARKLSSISVTRHAKGGYTLYVDGKPYIVKGACYLPVPTGKTYDFNFWGVPQIWKTDGPLMKRIGANTVRFYRPGKNPDEVKRFIHGLYRNYGIRNLMGHDLGFWDWPPPNYGLAEFRDKIKAEVEEMVRAYKDEPSILAWVLGNENNYSFEVMNVQFWTTPEIEAIEDPDARYREKAKIYYSFVNDVAKAVKKIDPLRPVIMGVGEVKSLHIAAEYATDIDILGMIVYRGPGFGNLFNQIKQRFDKPVIVIEWGADSFNVATGKETEDKQAEFIRMQWRDIERNTAGKNGLGNCLGGTVFEWHDEWWKANEHVEGTWVTQDKAGQFSNAAYYYDYDTLNRLNMNEEWYGIVALAPKPGDVDGRRTKQAYDVLKEFWKKNP